jgi:hypothetical protein
LTTRSFRSFRYLTVTQASTRRRLSELLGFAHERVQAAAIRLVEAGDALRKNAMPTTDYSYPKPNKIRFYTVTYDGVRVIEADRASVEGGSDKTSELFARAQDVVTELRLTTEDDQRLG